jgi:hypothetical protein
VFSFGAGKRGQLGILRLPVTSERPVNIEGLNGVNVRAVAAGGDHSAAITGKILAHMPTYPFYRVCFFVLSVRWFVDLTFFASTRCRPFTLC